MDGVRKRDSWSANTSLKKTFITVSNDVAGIVLGLQSSDEALQGMMLCMEFARLGAQAGDKADALKLADAIDSAISQQTEKAVVVNNVKFEVVPKELAGKCCSLPSQKEHVTMRGLIGKAPM
ncbi:hypothetical protein [Candidatus Reidiella endopervernicosa]|uniref:Uncharacterized protein n=1 Tax=Candidatus Reidiella endopervernicosa TaxID=2738883 RepID=A0A6N0HVE4_9GAMM|nr:hypothetical protein [Candidatus Reidiella endopervernicosa]QKQ26176.1 hypothetical protein HUE57_07660 [Candidatus Reidiella endopervernicosa]